MPLPVRSFALPLSALLFSAFVAACPTREIDRARELAARGAHKEAGELYVDIARADPANLAAWDGAVDAWCRRSVHVGECMNVLDLELKLLGNLERHKEALSEVLELRARSRIEQGLIDAALDDLSRAERASASRSSVFAARARAYAHVGDRDRALVAIERARELDPRNEELAELLGLLPGEAPRDETREGEAFGAEAHSGEAKRKESPPRPPETTGGDGFGGGAR